jgi:hypothetical protein
MMSQMIEIPINSLSLILFNKHAFLKIHCLYEISLSLIWSKLAGRSEWEYWKRIFGMNKQSNQKSGWSFWFWLELNIEKDQSLNKHWIFTLNEMLRISIQSLNEALDLGIDWDAQNEEPFNSKIWIKSQVFYLHSMLRSKSIRTKNLNEVPCLTSNSKLRMTIHPSPQFEWNLEF